MADIIGSKKYEENVFKDFREKIDGINKKNEFLSPLTITLGDEFQGVLTSLKQGIEVMMELEEALMIEGYPFKLRYAIGYGEIMTPINSKIAHGMYGEALTNTRELLEKSKDEKRKRFDIMLPNNEIEEIFNQLLVVYQSFLDNWKKKDYSLVGHFIEYKDYKEVAKRVNKLKDQIWRREKSLRIRAYLSQKEAILILSEMYQKSLNQV